MSLFFVLRWPVIFDRSRLLFTVDAMIFWRARASSGLNRSKAKQSILLPQRFALSVFPLESAGPDHSSSGNNSVSRISRYLRSNIKPRNAKPKYLIFLLRPNGERRSEGNATEVRPLHSNKAREFGFVALPLQCSYSVRWCEHSLWTVIAAMNKNLFLWCGCSSATHIQPEQCFHSNCASARNCTHQNAVDVDVTHITPISALNSTFSPRYASLFSIFYGLFTNPH